MLKDIKSSAAALYDGGWRSEDKDQLREEHNLTLEDVEELCKELERLEEQYSLAELRKHWSDAAILEAAEQHKNREVTIDEVEGWGKEEQEDFALHFHKGDFIISPENR